MSRMDAPEWALALLETEPVARLGLTDDAGAPRVLPITFARVGEHVWSAVDDKPKRRRGDQLARVRWLRARPRAALTVDRYDDDWERLAWVQLLGEIAILDEAPIEALQARYPAYRERAPRGPFLRLKPDRILCWRATRG
jgi:PPOX class probable F420-dependent enzyme